MGGGTSSNISAMADLAFHKKLYSEDPNDPSSGWTKKLDFTHADGAVVGKVWAKFVDGYDAAFVMWTAEYKDISME